MPNGDITSTINVGATQMTSALSRSATSEIAHVVELPAAIAGTLSTRTDADTGILTLASGHGITVADTVNVFWSGGIRYGMEVTNVDGDAVTVDGGAGDDFPVVDTVVTAAPQITVDTDWVGDNTELFAVVCTKRSHVDVREAAVSAVARELVAHEAWTWADDTGATNPVAGKTIAEILVSNGEAAAGECRIGVLYNGTA